MTRKNECDIIKIEIMKGNNKMFFQKPEQKLLNPLVDNIETLAKRGLVTAELPLYNWDTQEPQSFALSVSENNGEYNVKGSIVEQSRFRPINGALNDNQPSVVYNVQDIDRIQTHEVSTLFEGTVVNGKVKNAKINQDPRIPDNFNQTIVDYVVGNLSEYDYQDKIFRTFVSTNFENAPSNKPQLTISRDHLKDLDDGQEFYSIRQNGQLFEVVELNETDKLFGKYDLDARQSGTILKAYIDYNDVITDLQTRIKPENQKLDILRNEDLLDLIDSQTL